MAIHIGADTIRYSLTNLVTDIEHIHGSFRSDFRLKSSLRSSKFFAKALSIHLGFRKLPQNCLVFFFFLFLFTLNIGRLAFYSVYFKQNAGIRCICPQQSQVQARFYAGARGAQAPPVAAQAPPAGP
jgi:hypothetical protein